MEGPKTIFCYSELSLAPEMLSSKFRDTLVACPRKVSPALSSTDIAVSVRPCHSYRVFIRGSGVSCFHTQKNPQTCQLPEARDALPHHLHRFQVLVDCPAVQPPLLGLVSGRSVD